MDRQVELALECDRFRSSIPEAEHGIRPSLSTHQVVSADEETARHLGGISQADGPRSRARRRDAHHWVAVGGMEGGWTNLRIFAFFGRAGTDCRTHFKF